MELDSNRYAWKEGETLISYTPNIGRKLLGLAKLEVNIVKKRRGGGDYAKTWHIHLLT
jgi:hypothetical protein